MSEYWDVYDKFRNRTNKIIQRDSAERLKIGEYHIVVTGIIENSNKQILITRRNKNKKLYPGLWECTGGSAKTGESSIDAIIREIKEEIGIEFIQEEGKFLGTIQKKNYFRDVWKFKRDISKKDIYYNDGEVIDSKWVSLDEYVGLYNKGEVAPSGDFVIKMLKEKLLNDLKVAMKEKNVNKKNAVQMVRTAILQIEKDKGIEVSDEQIINIIAKEVKTRKDSIVEFEKAERQDLIDQTNEEIAVLEEYLPKQLTDKELENEVKKIVESVGATSVKDMGKVMKEAKVVIGAKADGKRINEMVKKILA